MAAGEVAHASPAAGGALSPEQLVAQLSDSDFATREAAVSLLLERGEAALSAVENAARSTDLETQTRATRLLVELRRRCFHQRLDAFVRDVAGRQECTLPGWPEFQDVMGQPGASREVFVELYRAAPELFRTAYSENERGAGSSGAGARQLASLISNRTKALQECVIRQRHGLQAETERHAASMALLLVSATHPKNVSERSTQHLAQIVRNQLKPLADGQGQVAHASRRLLTAWMLQSQTDDLYVLSQMLRLADELKLVDVAPLAIAIAARDRAYRPARAQFRASALLIAGKLGNESDIPSLASLLDDHAVCASQSGRGKQEELLDVEIRDVALAVMLHLAGEQPAEFGFDELKGHDEKLFLLHTLAFRDKERRDEALAQWRGRRVDQSPRIRIASELSERR